MNTTRKGSVTLDSAQTALQVAARKRRLRAFRLWQKGMTFQQVGNEFGVSRQRASQMVRKAESEFSPDFMT